MTTSPAPDALGAADAPALLVRSVRVTVDGRPVGNWGPLLLAALRTDSAALDARLRDARLVTSSLRRGSVLLPNTTLEMAHVAPGPMTGTLRSILNDSRVVMRVCYCSLYRDCWVIDNQADEPVPVADCPNAPAGEFRG